jgi:hypothetical protein
MIRLKSLLVTYAAVFGISGLMCIVAPSIILKMWGIETGPAALLTTQYDGVGSIAMALICWLLRDTEDSKTQSAVIIAMLITLVTGLVVSVSGMISGVMKSGWPVLGIFLFFTAAFAYSLFSKKK